MNNNEKANLGKRKIICQDHHGNVWHFDPNDAIEKRLSKDGNEILYKSKNGYLVLADHTSGTLLTDNQAFMWLTRNGSIVHGILNVTTTSDLSGAPASDLTTQPQSFKEKKAPATAHSPDFRSVSWFSKSYSFTATQAACIKVLWEAWEQGTPEMGEPAILAEAESNSPRMRDIFRNSPAWENLIVPGSTKGSFRLKEPKGSR